jgi:hypothetical protein
MRLSRRSHLFCTECCARLQLHEYLLAAGRGRSQPGRGGPTAVGPFVPGSNATLGDLPSASSGFVKPCGVPSQIGSYRLG